MTEVSLAGSTAPVSARFLFPFPFLPFTPSLPLLLLPSSSSFFVFFPILIRCLFFATWVKSTATPSSSPVQILNIDLAHPYNNRCGNNSRLEERLPLLPCSVPERDSIKREDKIEEGERIYQHWKESKKKRWKVRRDAAGSFADGSDLLIDKFLIPISWDRWESRDQQVWLGWYSYLFEPDNRHTNKSSWLEWLKDDRKTSFQRPNA